MNSRQSLIVLIVIASMSACTSLRREEVLSQPPVEVPLAEVENQLEVVKTLEVDLRFDQDGYPAPALATNVAFLTPTPEVNPSAGGGKPVLFSPPVKPNRMIIKNAEMRLLISDSANALDRVTQIAGDVGGYIISSRVWYQPVAEKNYQYASLSLGIPVDEFEHTLRLLRQLSIRVLDETAAGQDVTDEYVDLNSRLKNLEATRDRIRTFLEQARTVEEALQVNEQLRSVEGEIEQVMGRMNYIFDRAAYATITVTLEPEIPDPTPSPTPTPTPTPTPAAWSPAQTLKQASHTLGSIAKLLIDAGIWLLVVVLPLTLPFFLAAWGWRRVVSRRNKP